MFIDKNRREDLPFVSKTIKKKKKTFVYGRFVLATHVLFENKKNRTKSIAWRTLVENSLHVNL